MKRKSTGKKILITFICLLLVGAIGAGAWYVTANRSSEPVDVFPFMYVGMTEYWGDSQESYGFVQTDGVQTVFLSGTQNVTEVFVQLGQEVKKGDVLMSFDTTLSDLELERKRLDVEKLKLQLEDAKRQLREINAMRPMVIPQPSDKPDEDVDLGKLLTDPFYISENTDYDGSSSEKALICWLHSSGAIGDDIFDALLLKAREYQAINAEKEPEETLPGESTDPSDPSEAPSEETEPSTEATEPPTEETEPPTEETEPPTEATEPPAEEPSEPADPTEPAEPGEAPSDPTEPTQPQKPDEKFFVVIKITEGNLELAARTTWQGIYVIRDGDTGEYGFKFFEAYMVPDHTLSPDQEAEETPEIDFGSGFTAAQIAQMRSEQEKTIKDLEFSIKMAEADYKIAQTEVSDGKVYAEIDGVVVSLLTQEEAEMMQMPILKVSAGGGFYVEGTVSELDRDSLSIGQEVTINDWYTGMVYVGHIESLGDYPSADGYWNGMGNPTASYYPFRVFVEESADLQSGSYVSIQFAAADAQHGVYLENPFLRTEGGRSYVYVRGEDGTLEQRFVTTGKSLWGSYTEILEGLSEEDFIAFPYGKHVKPGAETVESDLSALYG